MPTDKGSAKAHTSAVPDQEVDIPNSQEESASSDHELDNEILFHPSRPQAPNLAIHNMFMPYVEGLKLDWTVNESLYHHFFKWKLNVKTYSSVNLLPSQSPNNARRS